MHRAEKWGRSRGKMGSDPSRCGVPFENDDSRFAAGVRPHFPPATTPFFLLCLALALTATPAHGQGQRGSQTAKAIAPIDLTGYWVSVVSEDWRHRMMTPRKGD